MTVRLEGVGHVGFLILFRLRTSISCPLSAFRCPEPVSFSAASSLTAFISWVRPQVFRQVLCALSSAFAP